MTVCGCACLVEFSRAYEDYTALNKLSRVTHADGTNDQSYYLSLMGGAELSLKGS